MFTNLTPHTPPTRDDNDQLPPFAPTPPPPTTLPTECFAWMPGMSLPVPHQSEGTPSDGRRLYERVKTSSPAPSTDATNEAACSVLVPAATCSSSSSTPRKKPSQSHKKSQLRLLDQHLNSKPPNLIAFAELFKTLLADRKSLSSQQWSDLGQLLLTALKLLQNRPQKAALNQLKPSINEVASALLSTRNSPVPGLAEAQQAASLLLGRCKLAPPSDKETHTYLQIARKCSDILQTSDNPCDLTLAQETRQSALSYKRISAHDRALLVASLLSIAKRWVALEQEAKAHDLLNMLKPHLSDDHSKAAASVQLIGCARLYHLKANHQGFIKAIGEATVIPPEHIPAIGALCCERLTVLHQHRHIADARELLVECARYIRQAPEVPQPVIDVVYCIISDLLNSNCEESALEALKYIVNLMPDSIAAWKLWWRFASQSCSSEVICNAWKSFVAVHSGPLAGDKAQQEECLNDALEAISRCNASTIEVLMNDDRLQARYRAMVPDYLQDTLTQNLLDRGLILAEATHGTAPVTPKINKLLKLYHQLPNLKQPTYQASLISVLCKSPSSANIQQAAELYRSFIHALKDATLPVGPREREALVRGISIHLLKAGEESQRMLISIARELQLAGTATTYWLPIAQILAISNTPEATALAAQLISLDLIRREATGDPLADDDLLVTTRAVGKIVQESLSSPISDAIPALRAIAGCLRKLPSGNHLLGMILGHLLEAARSKRKDLGLRAFATFTRILPDLSADQKQMALQICPKASLVMTGLRQWYPDADVYRDQVVNPLLTAIGSGNDSASFSSSSSSPVQAHPESSHLLIVIIHELILLRYSAKDTANRAKAIDMLMELAKDPGVLSEETTHRLKDVLTDLYCQLIEDITDEADATSRQLLTDLLEAFPSMPTQDISEALTALFVATDADGPINTDPVKRLISAQAESRTLTDANQKVLLALLPRLMAIGEYACVAAASRMLLNDYHKDTPQLRTERALNLTRKLDRQQNVSTPEATACKQTCVADLLRFTINKITPHPHDGQAFVNAGKILCDLSNCTIPLTTELRELLHTLTSLLIDSAALLGRERLAITGITDIGIAQTNLHKTAKDEAEAHRATANLRKLHQALLDSGLQYGSVALVLYFKGREWSLEADVQNSAAYHVLWRNFANNIIQYCASTQWENDPSVTYRMLHDGLFFMHDILVLTKAGTDKTTTRAYIGQSIVAWFEVTSKFLKRIYHQSHPDQLQEYVIALQRHLAACLDHSKISSPVRLTGILSWHHLLSELSTLACQANDQQIQDFVAAQTDLWSLYQDNTDAYISPDPSHISVASTSQPQKKPTGRSRAPKAQRGRRR